MTRARRTQLGYRFPPATTAPANAPFTNVLYGAAYYHEYMPYERLDKDVAMMKDAGINVVRMGESTWSLWEPADGKFEYAWMDRVVDAMGKAGIKVIMGTPTYSIPAWMAKRIRRFWRGPSWRRLPLVTGCGRTWTTDNPEFPLLRRAADYNLVEHYKDNPAVIGWQIDNETGSYGASNA